MTVQQPEEKFIDIKLPEPENDVEEEKEDANPLNLPQLNEVPITVDLDAIPERVKKNERKKEKWQQLVTKQ